jgi:hypothetical protein
MPATASMPTPKFLPLLLTLSLAAAFVAPPSGAPRRAAVRMTLRLDDDAAGKVSPSNIQMDPALGQLPSRSRRKVVAAVMAGLSAEAAWRQALSAAATAIEEAPSGTSILPPGTIQEIEAGRAVVLNKKRPCHRKRRQHSVQTKSHAWTRVISRISNRISTVVPS